MMYHGGSVFGEVNKGIARKVLEQLKTRGNGRRRGELAADMCYISLRYLKELTIATA